MVAALRIRTLWDYPRGSTRWNIESTASGSVAKDFRWTSNANDDLLEGDEQSDGPGVDGTWLSGTTPLVLQAQREVKK